MYCMIRVSTDERGSSGPLPRPRIENPWHGNPATTTSTRGALSNAGSKMSSYERLTSGWLSAMKARA
eukprot:15278763-Alexandrium_andersonii.AAC.1